MDDEVAIKVERVSKKYCKSLKKSMLYGVKDIGRNTFGLSSHSENLRKAEFWAVDDVSFEVKKGETLGIIGPNGSGKTTFLKMLNGIFWPDKGKITVKGKVGALIEVGAGFHPLLTGRENVYINAAILGMTKEEVDDKFDSIVEFADIGDFLDTPVKNYSSGMYVRLGFSVAVHAEPEILLVDEVLAVGDFAFQTKSYTRLNELKQKGITVVLVTHNTSHVMTFTERAIYLNHGKIVMAGQSRDVCPKYISDMNDKLLGDNSSKKGIIDDSLYGSSITNHPKIQSVEVNFSNNTPIEPYSILCLDPLEIKFRIETIGDLRRPNMSILIYRKDGMLMTAIESFTDRINLTSNQGVFACRVIVKHAAFNPGNYVIVLVFLDGPEYLYRSAVLEFTVKGSIRSTVGVVNLPHRWELESS